MPRLKKTKVLVIIDELANTTLSLRDIADKHNITLQTAFFINWGKNNHFKGIDYPIRKTTRLLQQELAEIKRQEAEAKVKARQDRYAGVISDLQHTDLSMPEIARKYRMMISEISRINAGERHKIEGMTYPLRKTGKQLNKEIFEDFMNGTSKEEICAKYNIDKNKLYDIVYYQEKNLGRKLWN